MLSRNPVRYSMLAPLGAAFWIAVDGAHAKDAETARVADREGVDAEAGASVRPGRSGFQMALGTGVALPYGDASGEDGDGLARRYSYQIPLNIEIGGRFAKQLYLGGYLGFAFGAEGDDSTIESYCEDDDDDGENDVSCSAVSIVLGAELRYGFAPDDVWNPWLSYGAGFEATNQSISASERGYDESTLASGFTYAKLGIGADYRGQAVGLGPFAQLALGRFESSTTRIGGEMVHRGSVSDKAWHAWMTLGLRLVISP